MLYSFSCLSVWQSWGQPPSPDLRKLGSLPNTGLRWNHKLSVSMIYWHHTVLTHNAASRITCSLFVLQLFPKYRGGCNSASFVQVQDQSYFSEKVKTAPSCIKGQFDIVEMPLFTFLLGHRMISWMPCYICTLNVSRQKTRESVNVQIKSQNFCRCQV